MMMIKSLKRLTYLLLIAFIQFFYFLMIKGNSNDWVPLQTSHLSWGIDSATLRTWHEAHLICTARGAHLVSIHSEADYDVLMDFTGNEQIWIGLNRYLQTNFEWTDETPFSMLNIYFNIN